MRDDEREQELRERRETLSSLRQNCYVLLNKGRWQEQWEQLLRDEAEYLKDKEAS